MMAGGSNIHRRISWGAIFGGVILVMTVQLLMSLLGTGIGLDMVTTNAGTTPDAGSLGIGTGAWWIISSIIALAFGGYSAAWLAGVELRWDGLLQQQAQAFLKPANPDPVTMSPQDAQKEVTTNLMTYAEGGPDAAAAETRIIAIMAAQQHISTDQASQQFDQAQAKLQQDKAQAIQTAKNTADATASAAARTSFAAFADLLIGSIAAAIGGSLAVQRRMHVERRVVSAD